jgi:hypothetical protein
MDAQTAHDEGGSELHARPASSNVEAPESAGGAAAAAAEQDMDADGLSAAGAAQEPDIASLPNAPSPMRVSEHDTAAGASVELPGASEDENMAVGQEERDQPPAKRAAIAADETMTDADSARTDSPAEAMT